MISHIALPQRLVRLETVVIYKHMNIVHLVMYVVRPKMNVFFLQHVTASPRFVIRIDPHRAVLAVKVVKGVAMMEFVIQ